MLAIILCIGTSQSNRCKMVLFFHLTAYQNLNKTAAETVKSRRRYDVPFSEGRLVLVQHFPIIGGAADKNDRMKRGHLTTCTYSPVSRILASCVPQKKRGGWVGGTQIMTLTEIDICHKWNVWSTSMAHLCSADRWGNCSCVFKYAVTTLQYFGKDAPGPFITLVSYSKMSKKKKKCNNECTYQREMVDWNSGNIF